MTERDQQPREESELTSQELRRQAAERGEEKPPRKSKRRRRLAYTFSLLGIIAILGVSSLYLIISGGMEDATPEGVIPSDSGRIEETFNVPSDNWEREIDPVLGSLGYRNGTLQLIVRKADSWLISRSTFLESPGQGSAIVQPQRKFGRDSAYGVMCHVQEDGDGYAFAVSPDGHFRIVKIVHAYEITLVEGEYDYVPSDRHELLFSCADGALHFSLDRGDKISVEDSTYTEGAFALFARAGEHGGLIVAFDEYFYQVLPPWFLDR